MDHRYELLSKLVENPEASLQELLPPKPPLTADRLSMLKAWNLFAMDLYHGFEMKSYEDAEYVMGQLFEKIPDSGKYYWAADEEQRTFLIHRELYQGRPYPLNCREYVTLSTKSVGIIKKYLIQTFGPWGY